MFMENKLPRVPVEPTGKAIQDHPTKVELAQDFASSRGWTHPGFKEKIQNAIFDPTGRRLIADNFVMLAWLIDQYNGFIVVDSGAWQIDPAFNALSDEEVFSKLSS